MHSRSLARVLLSATLDALKKSDFTVYGLFPYTSYV